MNKKIVMLFILAIFLISSISIVYAKIPSPADAFGNAFQKITKWFGYNIAGNEQMIIGLIRLMIFIALFVLFYQGQLWFYGKKGFEHKNQSIPIIVSLAVALISVLLIPKEIIVAISTTYGVIVSSALIGIPLVTALWFVMFVLPNDSRFWYVIKLIIVILVWFVLAGIVNIIEGTTIMSVPGVF